MFQTMFRLCIKTFPPLFTNLTAFPYFSSKLLETTARLFESECFYDLLMK